MTFVDSIIYMLIHVGQISLKRLSTTIMFYTKGPNLFSLKSLKAFVFIPLNLLLGDYLFHLLYLRIQLLAEHLFNLKRLSQIF